MNLDVIRVLEVMGVDADKVGSAFHAVLGSRDVALLKAAMRDDSNVHAGSTIAPPVVDRLIGALEIGRALYSVPGSLIDTTVEVRADSKLVKVYSHGLLVKIHPRQAPGGRSTKRSAIETFHLRVTRHRSSPPTGRPSRPAHRPLRHRGAR